MILKHNFKTALTSLQTNKTRSLLTILGIVIAITAIILIMSIGRGAEKLILDEISGMGAETIVIRPGREPKGPSDIGDTLFSESLTIRDVEALKKKSNVPDIAEMAPAVIVTGSVSYQGETFRPTTFGWDADFMSEMFKVFPEEGANFGEEEIRAKANVAVIGQKVKKELFGEESAVGKKIKIRDQTFRVIGVYPTRGQVAFANIDEMVLLPYTTAQSRLLGINHFHEIIVKATSPEVVDRTIFDIEATLRERHNITDPDKDDFFVESQQGLVKQIKNILGALTVFLASVVAIALVVGGIGVMNIMLVSVTERTREIGLRKAVGATDQNILIQFLLESVFLTALGGVISIILGGALSYFIAWVLVNFAGYNWTFILPMSAIFLGIGVSAFVGLVFGLYPARKAAKKSPIEALRSE